MTRTCFLVFLLFLAFNLHSQTTYYVNDLDLTGDLLTSAIGDDANPGTSAQPFLTISHAISQAADGDIIMLDAGSYPTSTTINVNKELTIEGASESLVSIDATTLSPYSLRAIETDGDNITLRNFTVIPAVDPGPGKAGFTIKAGSNSLPTIDQNLTLENITVDGAERTPFDIHGIDGVVINNLTANNTDGGNGLQLTGVHNATITGFSGTNNAWGSIAIYTSRAYDRGSDNVVIDGPSLSIDGNVYAQDDFGALNPSYTTDLFNTNISVTGWDFIVYNDDFRSGGDGPEYDFFYDTLADAVAGGTALNSQNGGNTGSIIYSLAGMQWVVGGTGYSIQAAIDAASPGDEVYVLNGTYVERLTIDKSIWLHGESETGVFVDGSGLPNGRGITINSGVTDVTIQDLTVQNFNGTSGNLHAGIYGIGGNNNLVVQNVTVQNNTGGSGFYANGPVSNVTLDFVTASGHNAGVARGIVIWNGLKENITITNCEVFGNSCCGIELQDGTSTGVNISDNYIHDNADNGIGVVGMQGPGVNIIAGNTLENNGRFGIEIKNPNGSGSDTGAGSIVVENNNVSRSVAITDLRDIVGIAAFRRGVLAGNVDVPTGVVIRNNTVSGYTQTSDSDGFGIVAEGTNHTVTGNNVSNCDVGIQRQAGHLPYPGDGNQNNIADDYFGRGNSPITCGVEVSGNTYAGNGVDTRDVGNVGDGSVTNVNTGAFYCGIQEAIDDATAGDVLEVAAGSYDENVVVNKAIDLRGPNYGVACGSRGAEAVIAPATGLPMQITADNVSVNGFEITAPSYQYAIVCGNTSDLSVAFNNIHDINSSATPALTTTHAIQYTVPNDPAAVSNVAFEDNCISNVGSTNLTGNSASAIGVLQSTTTGTLSNLSISRNGISNVIVNNSPWPTGKIAYGIILNAGGSGSYLTTTGKVVDAVIDQNNISNVSGHIATAIGLEGNTENASVTGNDITALSATKSATRSGGGLDLNALKFEKNRYAGTCTVENNRFAVETFSHSGTPGLGYAIANYVPVGDAYSGGTTSAVVASCNWMGSADVSEIQDNAALDGKILNKDGCDTGFLPYLTDGTDNDGSSTNGFEPLPGLCNGVGPVVNVTQGISHLTIQSAVDAANPGDQIEVAAGTYAENVIIDKSVDLRGPNYGVAGNAARGPEAIVTTGTADVWAVLFDVSADDVSIDGFLMDGDNPDLTSGFANTTAADIDAGEAVTAYYAGTDRLIVQNNIIRNLNYSAVSIYPYYTNGGETAGTPSSGHFVSDNLIEDMGTYDATSGAEYWGMGVLIYNNAYVQIENNEMNNVRLGVQTGNFYQATPDAGFDHGIRNNSISSRRRGVFHNLAYSSASLIEISGNTITALDESNESQWDGILISSMSVPTQTDNNEIDASGTSHPSQGLEAWNVDAATPASFNGGSITGVDVGVFVNNYEGYNSNAGDGASAEVSNMDIDAAIGVHVLDSPSSTSHAAVNAVVTNCNIAASTAGFLVEESVASAATASFNGNNITGGGDASGAAETIDATCNWWGTDLLVDVEAMVSGSITVNPLLTDGTDTDGGSGFQPDLLSCTTIVEGCTDSNACNYDGSANQNDGSCDYSCYGCTDPASADYDAGATLDDGSCDLCPTDNSFDTAVTLAATQTADAWYVDRYAPSGFTSPVNFDGANRLRHLILEFDGGQYRPSGFGSAFYNTQGRKYDLPEGTSRMSVDLYVPADWATTGRRMAGFWGTAFDPSDAVSGYPIIEFTSDDNGTASPQPRFRAYNNGVWVDMGLPTGFTYNSWVTLEMQLLPSGEFLFVVGDLVTATTDLAAYNSERIGNVILQGHNTDDGVTYAIHWDNFTYRIEGNGCTDMGACNYDPAATCDDGSCEFISCAGCTDPLALNYDDTATIEDGSCTYPAPSYTGLSYEVYQVDGVAGYTTYRVYANFSNQYDELTAVYGVVDGNENSPLSITTTGDFYQDPNGGLTSTVILPALFGAFPSIEFDSYLALGAPVGPNFLVTQGIAAGDFDTNGLTINSFLGGLWFVIPGTEPEATAGPDGKVMIGQFTTNGIVDMTVNLQYTAQDGTVVSEQQEQISFPDNIPGCTSSGACNYNPLATLDDGSCVFPGCMDDEACNYDASAGCPAACDYSCLTEFYVNDNDLTGDVYTSAVGDDLNPGTPSAPFATINHAISVAGAGATIFVDAGTFNEDVIVDRALDIRGANYGVSPNTGSRGAESIVHPATSSPFGEIFIVQVSDVSIDGFTIDGDNPALTSGYLGTNGADLDAAEAVTVYYDNVNNLNVSNNVITNLTYFGVTIFGASYSAPTTSGHQVVNNLISDLGTYDSASGIALWGGGVLLYNDQYTYVADNVISNARIGVQTGNFHDANTGAAMFQAIENNEMSVRRRGIFYNLHTGASVSPLTLQGNTITAVADPNESVWDGILMSSLSNVSGSAIDNVIDGSAVALPSEGIEVWNVDAASPAIISGGSVTGVDVGVFVNNYEGYNSDAGNGAHAEISDMDISVNAGGIGVRVLDSPSSTAHANVDANISNNFISGGAANVSIEGGSSSAYLLENSLTGADLAIDASAYTGSAATAECNWFGTSDLVAIQALVAGTVDNAQVLTDGTDDDAVSQGFQPVAGACLLVVGGCTDSNACNYDMTANLNDGSCDYSCYGCTDPLAANYDGAATIDDGSCDVCATNGDFSAAVVTTATQTPGAWYVDRYEPAVFSSPTPFDGDDRLRHIIFELDGGQYRPSGFSSAFYNTQGRKYDLPAGALSMSVELYVPADWATTGRRMAGFWGTAFDAADAVSGYPIIEFTSDDNGTGTPQPRFRAYDNGVWVDMGLPGGFAYDSWVNLEMRLVPATGEFIFTVGDLEVATTELGAYASERIGNVILQGHNTDDGVTYVIHWDNFTYSVIPNGCTDPTACNYDPAATCDDGSCILPNGCTDMAACNYDPAATCDDGSCEFTSCVGCTDPLADNYEPDNTVEDGSCTYCASTLTYDVTGPDPIFIGSGISNDHMAVSADCNVSASIKAIERFVGDIVPTGAGDVYRVESGESPTSGVDPTPAAGLAKWNYVFSVNLGSFSAEDVKIYLDVDFDPAVAAGSVYTADISQFLIDNGQGGLSLVQDSQNLGFGFWQAIGDPAITVFDPFANGQYDLTIRVESLAGVELVNAPISVEVYTPGCTDPLADNYNANANEEDGSCTYCPATLAFDVTGPDPIFVGSGLSNDHMALGEDCNVSAALKAHLRFNGDIIPTGNLYRSETGESPVSGVDPTPDPGIAKWNFLFSVNLGSYTFDEVDVFLDIDFDPAVAPGSVYTVDVSQVMIDNGLGNTSLVQDSQNLGFDFWQAIGDPAIIPFDPFANGLYDLAVRVVSPNGVELLNVPIQVETYTEGCTDSNACNYNPDATDDDGSCIAPTTWYADTDGDGFGDAAVTTDACTQPAGFVADDTDCDDTNGDVYPGAPGTEEGIDNNCNGVIDLDEQLPCLGDFNDDGQRNTSDLLILLGDFGCGGGCVADMNYDDQVGTADILAFLGVFAVPCP